MFGEKRPIKKYIIMSRYKDTPDFYQSKAFASKEDADKYAELMLKVEGDDGHNYFLFEQSKDYSEKISPMDDFRKAVNE